MASCQNAVASRRRGPPDEATESFCIRDANGQALVYVYRPTLAKLPSASLEAARSRIMVRPRAPTVRWLVIVAALVIGPAANSEPIHLACEGR